MEFVRTVAPEGVGIFEARVLPAAGGFHFEVVLDGLNDPRGAVSVADCDHVSRELAALLDREALEPTPGWEGVLPAGLTAENFSLEVSSAGAERKLRLPEDLERFKGLPIRLKIPAKTEDGKDTITVHLVVFAGKGEDGHWYFQEYEPKNTRANRVRRRRAKRNAEKAGRSGETAADNDGPVLRLGLQDFANQKLKANLYLDY